MSTASKRSAQGGETTALYRAMIGVVLAIAAQGAWGWINLRRVEEVNRAALAAAR
jgi:hypothetical protein